MKRLRIMVLMHSDLVPPDSMEGHTDEEILEWKTEFDVLSTLNEMGHEARPVGVSDDLSVIRHCMEEFQPHIAFNLLEEFHGYTLFDSHVVSYLVLKKQKFTGCNPRGLMLAHDKVLCKQILSYHRIPTPRFCVFPQGRTVRKPARLSWPLFIKSSTEDASHGLSHKSIVHSEAQLRDRVQSIHDDVGTDALCEEYIEGRELYVGILGNTRLKTFKTWELKFDQNREGIPLIATREAKWDPKFQLKYGVMTYEAEDLDEELQRRIRLTCKRIYRALFLTGYARIDLRLTDDGRLYVLEANPNPNLSYGEDFAESAEAVGIKYEELLSRILSLGMRYDPTRSA